ncbi:sulfate permease [Violaceomyces palustris]|uniref:Sulfate permease n=1 Tax=Violaceomyces palustris TaxID=1673888 RepID=A0ACD0P0W1_9BASI|nr:sulfate permease [Violaceomyces palustris]
MPLNERDQGPSNKVTNAWKWLIGYNDTEANRIGVPIVSSKDWLADIFSHPGAKAADYLDSLFPFRAWIPSYNLQWAIGDLIAGVTVALVLVPQSMSYATLAGLKPEFGLYSSFVGVMIYALFATSKDVTIGPVAVMSLQTHNVIVAVMAKTNAWSAEVIATALAFISGVICLGIGIIRIGWIIEFIPTPAVSGFMTGSAISIAAGQVPKLMGLKTVVTNSNPTYKVIINSFKALPQTDLNAAFGLTALAFLYIARSFCRWLPTRYPRLAKTAFFMSVLRNAFVIIVLTIASRIWVGQYKDPKKYPISILKTVPRGFKHMGQPNVSPQLLSDMASQLPVSVIVLLLEHIAIAKSFGRLNNYKINPNQELIAIGVTNLVGPCFGAYAATGSFSRTAIKSKSGVRTPLAGWVTGILVLISIYALTGTFYWIPNAALSAVIIHAVGDLIAPPALLYKFWLVSPFELVIWLAAVLTTVFSTIENGVYVSVAASLALLLIRIARPRGRWLGTVRVHHGTTSPTDSSITIAHRDVFVPLDDKDGLRDPSIRVDAPPPGILIYRFEEAFTYPNASHLADLIIDKAKEETRPGKSANFAKLGDRPWHDPGAPNPALIKAWNVLTCRRGRNVKDELEEEFQKDPRPLLKAIIFDFSSVSNVDTTSIQTLVDVRTSVERYADAKVEFHFANILSPWIRRALLAGGFGTGNASRHITEIAPVVSQKEVISEEEQAKRDAKLRKARQDQGAALEEGLTAQDPDRILSGSEVTGYPIQTLDKKESGSNADGSSGSSSGRNSLDKAGVAGFERRDSQISVPIIWGNDLTPFFHLDLSAALAAATSTGAYHTQTARTV